MCSSRAPFHPCAAIIFARPRLKPAARKKRSKWRMLVMESTSKARFSDVLFWLNPLKLLASIMPD